MSSRPSKQSASPAATAITKKYHNRFCFRRVMAEMTMARTTDACVDDNDGDTKKGATALADAHAGTAAARPPQQQEELLLLLVKSK